MYFPHVDIVIKINYREEMTRFDWRTPITCITTYILWNNVFLDHQWHPLVFDCGWTGTCWCSCHVNLAVIRPLQTWVQEPHWRAQYRSKTTIPKNYISHYCLNPPPKHTHTSLNHLPLQYLFLHFPA